MRNRGLEFRESLQHRPIRRRCMRLPKREEKREPIAGGPGFSAVAFM
jgi:hypothetical protein